MPLMRWGAFEVIGKVECHLEVEYSTWEASSSCFGQEPKHYLQLHFNIIPSNFVQQKGQILAAY
jgi:hypothetical protein